jgi:hypothetical protein
MRGLEESDTGGTMEVTFAPQYTFNGDVNRQDLEEANAISFKQFEKFMDEYNKKQRRTKWA